MSHGMWVEAESGEVGTDAVLGRLASFSFQS